MHKNILTVVGITILFLGLTIQPSLATVQPEKIDVEPDIEGLVAQLRVVINEILHDYGHIPIVKNLGNMILDWYPGFFIICVFLTFYISFFYAIWIYAPQIWNIFKAPLQHLLIIGFKYFIEACSFYYYPLKPIFTLSGKNDISQIVSECPCMQ